MRNSASDKSFRTPAAHSADSEYDHSHRGEDAHDILSQKKFSSVKYLLSIHPTGSYLVILAVQPPPGAMLTFT